MASRWKNSDCNKSKSISLGPLLFRFHSLKMWHKNQMVEVIQLLLIPAMGKSDNVTGRHQYYLCEEKLCLLSGGKQQKSYRCPSLSLSSPHLLF